MSRAKRDRAGKRPSKFAFAEVVEVKTVAPSRAASKKNDGPSKASGTSSPTDVAKISQ